MSIQPEGEALRKAVKWVSEEQKYNPETPLATLLREAGLKFDLSPKEAEFLFRFFMKEDR